MGEETVSETQETVDTLPVPKPEEAVKREGKYSVQYFFPSKVFNIFVYLQIEDIISIRLMKKKYFFDRIY